LASQRAGDGRVDPHAPLRQVLAQSHALALAQLAELVVVIGAKRSLAMAHKVKRSHSAILGGARAHTLSRLRLPAAHQRRKYAGAVSLFWGWVVGGCVAIVAMPFLLALHVA
jgi:hypothetical protein